MKQRFLSCCIALLAAQAHAVVLQGDRQTVRDGEGIKGTTVLPNGVISAFDAARGVITINGMVFRIDPATVKISNTVTSATVTPSRLVKGQAVSYKANLENDGRQRITEIFLK